MESAIAIVQEGRYASPSIMAIKEDAGRILHALAEFEKEPGDANRGRYALEGDDVRQALQQLQNYEMTADQINDAVTLLKSNGFIRISRYLGTMPYDFGEVELTPAGRLRYEEAIEQQRAKKQEPILSSLHTGERIFIGHGRSLVWRDLKDFISERLGLAWDEFNRESTAGYSTKERLQAMLAGAKFAFLVMTAEDERADGAKVARANVIHEVGLFQGRLGFERAIVLLEEGCEEFSNITGITQIRFPANNIKAAFEEIRRVLEREKILIK